ncbi:Uncharacterised protein [uncultured archaeon]|nr:Uncharacterised protein [uncultured archaeon]
MPRHRGKVNAGQGFLSFGKPGIDNSKLHPPSAGKPAFALASQVIGKQAAKPVAKNSLGNNQKAMKENRYTWLDAAPTPGNPDKGRGIWRRLEEYHLHIGEHPNGMQIRKYFIKCALEEFEAQAGRKPTPKEKELYLAAITRFLYRSPPEEFVKTWIPF